MPTNYPELTRYSPVESEGLQDALRPSIVLDWTVDIAETQFSDNALRAQTVLLLKDSTSEVVDTDFISYTARTRRVVLAPAADLDRGARYRIVVRSRVPDSYGRRSQNEYNWTFTTAGTEIGSASLVSPGNATVQPIFPTLSWLVAAATGAEYRVQVDERFDFGSPAYDQTVTGLSTTPTGTFVANTTYYWRVLSFVGSSNGSWSDTRSFYYGSTLDAHLSSRSTLADPDPFGILRTGFTNGASNLGVHPTLSLVFSSTPASGYDSFFEVVSASQLPRNDDTDTYWESTVAGTWALVGNTATFTPDVAITANTRYEIRVSGLMVSEDSIELGEDRRFYWCGRYTPFYCSPRSIRARFRSAEQVPEDLMNWYIFRASLMAKAKFYSYTNASIITSWDALSEAQVRDSTDLTSHAVGLWVEATTTLELLKSILHENIRDVDRTRTIQRFQDSLGPGFLDAIRLAMEEARKDLRDVEGMIVPTNLPIFTGRHSQFSTDFWTYDLMNYPETSRGDENFFSV